MGLFRFRLRVAAFRAPKLRPRCYVVATSLSIFFSPKSRDMEIRSDLIRDLPSFLSKINLILIFLIRQLENAGRFELLIVMLLDRGLDKGILITFLRTLAQMHQFIEFLLIEVDGWVGIEIYICDCWTCRSFWISTGFIGSAPAIEGSETGPSLLWLLKW